MAKKIITMYFFISVDLDNYHDKYHIFISFNFKGRFLLLSVRSVAPKTSQGLGCRFTKLNLCSLTKTVTSVKKMNNHPVTCI